jgi:hypothetical protein|nr:MAG TPA: hypothetical protein [Caudoviricetes sp.]
MGNTKYSEIYDQFLDRITDDMYISWSKEETYADLAAFLSTAIARFHMPHENLRDKEDVGGEICFTSELSYRTIDILTLLMEKEWLNRQLRTVKLTELQYTGSDAKVLNTKSQAEAIIKIKEDLQRDLNQAYHNYQYETTNTETKLQEITNLNLAGVNKDRDWKRGAQ